MLKDIYIFTIEHDPQEAGFRGKLDFFLFDVNIYCTVIKYGANMSLLGQIELEAKYNGGIFNLLNLFKLRNVKYIV